jgi:hypothetical protein
LIRWPERGRPGRSKFNLSATVEVPAPHDLAERGGWDSRRSVRVEAGFPDPKSFMLLELFPGALAGRSGAVRYRPEFASL